MSQSGQLWVIATPIGNLSDLSDRAIEALTLAHLVAAEDTRRIRKLLSHLTLQKPLLRCDEAAEERATGRILQALTQGENVALVSDAGTPTLSDPGCRLIAATYEAGETVVPIVGPSAITAALSVCGFRATPFRFWGFLARKKGARNKELTDILSRNETAVFFESPHRIARTLAELTELEPDRLALVARELTKKFEELLRAPVKDLAEQFATRTPRGEFTVVVSPPKKRVRSKMEKM